MPHLSTTKMSSKGQVVIPEDIRKKLNIKPGAQFVVLGDKDTVILKAIKMPSKEEFDAMMAETRRQAKEAGLTPKDIEDAISEVRGRK